MQCGEGADEANYDGGVCGYVGSIGNDGGGGKEKNHHNHTTNTTNKAKAICVKLLVLNLKN